MMKGIDINTPDTERRKYLVICRAGDESLHRRWLEPKGWINFDLMISYYGNSPGLYRDDCIVYEEKKGPRYIPLQKFILKNLELVLEYDAVWLAADDLNINAESINKMFHLFNSKGLWLAQPALTADSYYSHKITLQNKNCLLRYTNFVEVMAPIFSRDTLLKCLFTFEKSTSGWGLDYIWPCILGYPEDKIAIIDSITVEHMRPIGKGGLYKNFNTFPREESIRLASEYNVKVPYEKKIYKEIYRE